MNNTKNLWKKGTYLVTCKGRKGYKKYFWEAKVYDEGSVYGINTGRISKLGIWLENNDGTLTTVCNYDRGWDIKPINDEVLGIVDYLVNVEFKN